MQVLLLVLKEGLCRLGDEDLPAVAGGTYARGPMHGEAGVAPVARDRLPRVQTHPHLDLHTLGPRVRQQGKLALDCGEKCLSRTRERDEEGVALRVDLVSAVSAEGRAKQPLMIGQHAAVAVAEVLDEPCGPFDVAEEEGDSAGGYLGHAREA